jgi:radical SAM protein with 4Fe4S-binding SPASM domain
MNLSCPNNCNHCSYGRLRPVDFAELERLAEKLSATGWRVHFYDMHVTASSIGIFRSTRQFEVMNPGWLNVNCDFDPSFADAAYLSTLQTAILLSLHGSRPEVHGLLSGRPEEHGDIVAALRRLRQQVRLRLGINYVVHAKNIDDIPAMIAFAREHLPVDFIEFINLGYGGNSLTSLDPSFALDQDAFRRAYQHLRREKKRARRYVQLDAQWGPDFVDVAVPQCTIFAPPVPDHYCNAGRSHFALRADTGEVFPCPTMATLPATRVGRLVDGAIVIDNNWILADDRLEAPCADCDRRALCGGGCRAIALCDNHLDGSRQSLWRGFANCLYQAHRRGALRHAAG